MVLRPLIGHDKIEIIATARRLGTYAISKRPEPDCCTLFAPTHPILQAREEICADMESNLDVEGSIRDALSRTTIELYANGTLERVREPGSKPETPAQPPA